MLLNNQYKYINYILEIEKEFKSINLNILDDKIKETKNNLENVELIVPIIGAFSAGKSTFINSFLEMDYLPVGITPETSLATELRYSENEYIEAINSNNETIILKKEAILNVKDSLGKYKYIRVYLNNKKLKKIEPFIIVDMPGFDSPLDVHNQAILNYINKGVHYIILTSIEDGNITRSMERQLQDIQSYQRDFSFFLSKSNLRANSEIQQVKEKLEEQIEDYFDKSKEVIPINNKSGESLETTLDIINPEKIIDTLFLERLKDNYFDILENLNTMISSIKNTKNENNEIINELLNSKQKMILKKDSLIKEVKYKYSEKSSRKIIECVGKSISNSQDELISIAINQGEGAFSQELTNIIRHSIIENLSDVLNDLGEEIISEFTIELKELKEVINPLTLNENWLEDISSIAKKNLNNLSSNFSNSVKNYTNSKSDKNYKLITSIAAITTSILSPILEIVIVFLPDLLGTIFERINKSKKEEELKNKLLVEIIPKIKRELTVKVDSVLNNQVSILIKDISVEFEKIIEEKEQLIKISQKEKEENIKNIDEQIQTYENLKSKITKISNEVLFKKGE